MKETIDRLEIMIDHITNNCIVIEKTDDIEQVKNNVMTLLDRTFNEEYLALHGLVKEVVIEKVLLELAREYKKEDTQR